MGYLLAKNLNRVSDDLEIWHTKRFAMETNKLIETSKLSETIYQSNDSCDNSFIIDPEPSLHLNSDIVCFPFETNLKALGLFCNFFIATFNLFLPY